MIEAKVVADSVSPDGVRLTTVQARIHRFILPEITRHRVFSFSVGSSRAVPTKKIIEQVESDPAMPVFWGKNQPGMVADEECNTTILGNITREELWSSAAYDMLNAASLYNEAGYHKQIVNRLLEPFQWCDLIMTGTEWENFFKLRIDYAAQPEIREAAIKIRDAMEASTPTPLKPGDWHMPYVPRYDEDGNPSFYEDPTDALNCSAARVARVSYLNHDRTNPDVGKDLSTASRLLNDGHWSPFEHQATPMTFGERNIEWGMARMPVGTTHMSCDGEFYSGNLRGWTQYRQLLEE